MRPTVPPEIQQRVERVRLRMRDRTWKLQRGPTGRPLCYWCEGEIPAASRRQTWCGQACVDEFMLIVSQAYARRLVKRRDGGVCRACGLDTERLRRHLRDLDMATHSCQPDVDRDAARQRLDALVATLGPVLQRQFAARRWVKTLWAADHIVALVDGGSTDLENLQTLCLDCHNEKSNADRRRRRAG